MWQPSLQSMANIDKILGAPTVPHHRCGCAKTVQKSPGAPLHYEYHCTNMKTPKSEGRPGALSLAFKNFLGVPLPCSALWVATGGVESCQSEMGSILSFYFERLAHVMGFFRSG